MTAPDLTARAPEWKVYVSWYDEFGHDTIDVFALHKDRHTILVNIPAIGPEASFSLAKSAGAITSGTLDIKDVELVPRAQWEAAEALNASQREVVDAAVKMAEANSASSKAYGTEESRSALGELDDAINDLLAVTYDMMTEARTDG